MAKVNFTSERVASFVAAPGRQQSILWDARTPGLGLRVTATGARSYIYETRLNGKSLRITIGNARAWTIGQAQSAAAKLKVQTDQGIDPRQVRAAEKETLHAAKRAATERETRESVTLGEAWSAYVAEREENWSASHTAAHRKMIQHGGRQRTRSPKLTVPGPIAPLGAMRLVDISPAVIEAWAKSEAAHRPASGRLAFRLLKAFFNWCGSHPTYGAVAQLNPVKNGKAREVLGKSRAKRDVLQREQLAAWFAAVVRIGNPVISSYLQILLLTGARRDELAKLRWTDVDFRWNSMSLNDKVDDRRTIPLTPYVAKLILALPSRNEWVFSSTAAKSGRLTEPRIAHNQALATAGLPALTLHGLRRSFGTLCEWIDVPSGVSAQLMGHKPSALAEKHYRQRPLDMLRRWHVEVEKWILNEAGLAEPAPAAHV